MFLECFREISGEVGGCLGDMFGKCLRLSWEFFLKVFSTCFRGSDTNENKTITYVYILLAAISVQVFRWESCRIFGRYLGVLQG